ncbi:MAG: M23 family metallopeptidase [Treponema sp.]|jgi:murein DD-endopeptidase MepM/ murein hydrolase activator NlpD|nr:M23 family metallopeptidase [Treponema sp.]
MYNYKRFESDAIQKMKRGIIRVIRSVGGFCKFIFRGLVKQYTVVLVPHSEKRVYNLHINILTILCFVLTLVGLGMGVFYHGSLRLEGASITFSDKDSRLQATQASLDQIRDETKKLILKAKNFESALSSTLDSLGVDMTDSEGVSSQDSDLSSLLNIQTTPEGSMQEINDLQQLSSYLETAVKPIKEIDALLKSQSALLTEIPSIWPIKGGIGHISFRFGQQQNPFTDQYYIHKGIDLSTYRQGDPVVASADGQVVTVDYDASGFGNYIIIKHKHGFYTRYGHLLSVRVRTGQRVQQNEVIGYIGNTGLSTGPHLHYEVHIGSDVVDPQNYLNIRSSLARMAK